MSQALRLCDGPAGAELCFLLAHGAGAPMDTPFMTAFAEMLAAAGHCVIRFEFAYMAQRRDGGSKRPPPRAERLVDEFVAVIDAIGPRSKLVIGGKSLGGRVAALAASDMAPAHRPAGLLCLGFPFHPPRKPEKSRTPALLGHDVPTLICQGERDPFGTREEVQSYGLPANIEINWAPDGDHDLTPRKSSPHSAEENWRAAADAILHWARALK